MYSFGKFNRYKGRREGKKRKKDKKAAYIAPQKKQQQKLDDLKGTSCFFSVDKGMVSFGLRLT